MTESQEAIQHRHRERQIQEEKKMNEEERLRNGQQFQKRLKQLDDAWFDHQKRERRQMFLVLFLIAGVICLLCMLEAYL